MLSKRRRGYRNLHRPDGIWQYKIGKNFVVLYSPRGSRMQARCCDVAGIDQYNWERARYKGYDQLTPSMVNEWLNQI